MLEDIKKSSGIIKLLFDVFRENTRGQVYSLLRNFSHPYGGRQNSSDVTYKLFARIISQKIENIEAYISKQLGKTSVSVLKKLSKKLMKNS